MNGRVFAVNRSPVLAWNVEPQQLQVPYPDMPAAAAISPVVPAAASDPYGRCWQNQVDAGTSFPYFGLYNNSLPPTPYRLQPGCMANLGQFWPPTPPPDGCGRFDGSNLYFGPPVLRHGENIPTNLRNSFQGLGHYSHLVETPKEPSQRVFKRETPLSPTVSSSSISMSSPATKSDNLSTYCVVDSKLKTSVSISSSLPKQEILPVSSGHEPYVYASDARNSSNIHPSSEKSCFSPSYSLKNMNFHNSPQDNNAHKANALSGTQENNCNASPLKNVYFSHFESENVNSAHSKSFSKGNDGHLRFDHKNNLLEGSKSKIQHQSLNGFILHNNYPPKKYDYQGSPEICNVTASNMVRADRQSDRMLIVSDRYRQRNSTCNVKPEKNSHLDCKFQLNSKSAHSREFRNSDDAFNIPTSVMQPKIEPNEKYFLTSCSSAAPSCIANSYSNSGPFLLATDLRTGSGYRSTFTNSCSLSKPWPCSEMPIISPDSYFKTPEAAKPPVQGTPLSNSAFHDGVISVAQTAPQEIDSFRNGKLHRGTQPSCFLKKSSPASEMDDDVQIIGVQNKALSSKNNSRHPQELKPNFQHFKVSEPLCLKTEKESEDIVEVSASTSSSIQMGNNKVAVQKPEMISLEGDNDRSSVIEQTMSWTSVKSESKSDVKFEASSLSNEKQVSQNMEYNVLNIKREIADEHEIMTGAVKVENLPHASGNEQDQSMDITSRENVDSDVKNNVNSFGLTSSCKNLSNEIVPTSVYNDENHGLNLLLNTIEKVTLFEASNNPPKTIKTECVEEMETNDSSFQNFPSSSGLDLLSVIAGQRLVDEFDEIKKEPMDSESIKSNYPDVKREKMSDDESSHKTSEMQANSQKSSVFEMQDRLVELQKKYKQKQKELSRLKPKKRLANTYLKGHLKIARDDTDQFSSSNNESASDVNSSTNSETLSVHSNAEKTSCVLTEVSVKIEVKSDCEETKPSKRKLPIRKIPHGEIKNDTPIKRITRTSLKHSVKRLKCRSVNGGPRSTRSLRKITRSSKNKMYKLRNIKDLNSNNQSGDIIEICSKNESLDVVKKVIHSDCEKSKKVYSLRHSSNSKKKRERLISAEANITVSNLKTISSKRKSDNPKKFMPSKQSKLSETIIAKHLRSRILFDTSGSISDDDNLKDGGVPEELYDALMKCHLGDESRKMEIVAKKMEKSEVLENGVLGCPEPSLLKLNHLIEKQRLLALEDGLFYAGCIKEVQVSDRYGIVLDGQRGNKLHVFSQEELLTQAIVESKPLSSELPEGTKVCAYWSQQYRCLYPGVIGKAPSPSADWSEPRVFVLFDDGDSGQIPTKNVRLLPSDILPALNEQVTSAKSSDVKLKTSMRGKASRALRCSTSKGSNLEHCDTGNENESKESSCASINESSCDDSCSVDYSLSPSQNPENLNSLESCTCSAVSCTDSAKLKKRQRKRSKRKTGCHIKFKDDSVEGKDKCEAKTKRHKKYKDKHRKHHHHHHHHRHNHHHHHHHHSKKRKHRRRNGKNQNQDSENFALCSADRKTFQSEVETHADLVDHSSTLSLPQNDHDRVC